MNSHLKNISAALWVSYFLCAAVFLYLLVCAGNVVFVHSVQDRDKSIRDIQSSTDLRYVQERAVSLVKLGWYTGQMSMRLLLVAIGTLLVVLVCTIVSLLQIRRLRRKLNEPTRDT